MMTTFDELVLARLRIAIQAGSTVIAAMKSGPMSVPMMNHFVRTRSMNSRRTTATSLGYQWLAMAAHVLLDAGGADFLQEDLVQRGLHELEAVDRGPGRDEAAEQLLRVGAGRQLHLDEPVLVVGAIDERAVGEDV